MAVSMTFGGYVFDPAPQLTLTVSHIRDDVGNLINIQNVASLQGKIVSLGKPTPGILNISEQMTAMRSAFTNCSGCQRFLFECDGVTLIDAYAKARGLSFSPSSDNWVFTADYTAELEWSIISDVILASGINTSCLKCLTQTNESWDIQQVDSPVQYDATGVCPTGIPLMLQVSHQLSAKGYNCCSGTTETAGYLVAKSWVESRLGYTSSILSAISGSTFRVTPSAFVAYNQNRQISINQSAGEYGVTESWLLAGDSGVAPYTEEYTVESNTDQSSRFTNVSIQGTITGLETRNSLNQLQTSKWGNANAAWANTISPALYSRANCLANSLCPLNSTPVSSSVTKNPSTGTITYNYAYNSKVRLIPRSLSEVVNVSDTNKSSQIITIPIIGRRTPYLYDLRLNSERERSVSISVLMSQPTGCFNGDTTCQIFDNLYSNPPTSGVDALLCCLERNLSGIAANYYCVSNTSEWNPIEGQYTKNITWKWSEACATETPPSGFCG